MRKRKYKYRKPKQRRKAASTLDAKAKSMQTSWRTATAQTGTLSLDDARALLANPPACPYCGNKIFWKEFSIDHKQPRSRGGPNQPDNLVWCCRTCNQIKGDLTAEEYLALLTFLSQYPQAKQSVLLRLRISAAMFRRRKR